MIDFNSKQHQYYKKNWSIYENDPPFRRPKKGKYLPVAIGKEIVQLYSDLAFKDNINAHIKEDEEANGAIDRLIFENEFDTLLSEISISVAAKGGAVFKNYNDDSKSKITYIEPEYYFPTFDKFNKRKILTETVGFPYVENEKSFLHREIYERKEDGYYWCTTKINTFYNNVLGEELESEEVNTYLTQSPLTYVPYGRHNGEFFGHSIFYGIEELIDEFNWRVSQISHILDKHSNPSIIGDISLLDEKYQFKKMDSGIFIPVEKDEIIPSYLTWNSELKANFEFIEEVIMKIFILHHSFKSIAIWNFQGGFECECQSNKIKILQNRV